MRIGCWKAPIDWMSKPNVTENAGNTPHIISYRRAKRSEREVYHDWLENDYDDD